jgi:hypothetical protein
LSKFPICIVKVLAVLWVYIATMGAVRLRLKHRQIPKEAI